MIGGDAVRERVRAAGVFRDVPADGAGFLAGGIRREVKAVRLGGQCDVEIDDAGLDNGALIFRIDGQDAVHAREDHHQAAGAGERAAGEAGASAAADDRNVVLGGQFDDLRNFFRRSGKDYDFGASFFDRTVVFVEKNIFRLKENGGRAEKFFEIAK